MPGLEDALREIKRLKRENTELRKCLGLEDVSLPLPAVQNGGSA
jgi:hypothetical protein